MSKVRYIVQFVNIEGANCVLCNDGTVWEYREMYVEGKQTVKFTRRPLYEAIPQPE
jgi:hypothetical protein